MQVSANNISLEVEDHGSVNGEPLVLIMGLGMQLTAWHQDFVQSLVTRGFRVLRFDNRDIGLSQAFDHLGTPNIPLEAMRRTLGLRVHSAYTLADMADDTSAILDVLGIQSAHICGASMGGMIAQHMAVRHASRVRSTTLMMTTTGAAHLPGPSLKLASAMMSRPDDPKNLDSIVAHQVRLQKMFGSPGYPTSDAVLVERTAQAVRRSRRHRGMLRQLSAITADADRTSMLKHVRHPVRIVHGLADPLVSPNAARQLAASICGSEMDLIEGMGHDLPVQLWPRFVSSITSAAGRA